MNLIRTYLALLIFFFAIPARAEDSFPNSSLKSRPTYWEAETPLSMSGMLLSETLMGVGAGLVAGNIMASRSEKNCRDRINPDFSDECGWSGLAGFATGFAVALPLGQGLGVMLAGAIQNKHGSGLLTLATAYVGDLVTSFLIAGLYNSLDGNVVTKGDDFLLTSSVILAGTTMLALPILTYTAWDYHVRFPLRPNLSRIPGGQGTRVGLQIAEMKF